MKFSILSLLIIFTFTLLTGCEDPKALEAQNELNALNELEQKLASLSQYIEANLSQSQQNELDKSKSSSASRKVGDKYASGISLQLEKSEDSIVRVQGDIERRHRVELKEIIDKLEGSKSSTGVHATWVEQMIGESKQLLALYDFRKAVKHLADLQHKYVPVQAGYYKLGMTRDRATWHEQSENKSVNKMIANKTTTEEKIAEIKSKISEAESEITGIDSQIAQHQDARNAAIEKATDAKNQATVSTGEKYTKLMHQAIEQERISARETGQAEKWMAQKDIKQESLGILQSELRIREAEYEKVKSDIAAVESEIQFGKDIYKVSDEEANESQRKLTEDIELLNIEFTEVIAQFDESIEQIESAISHFAASQDSRKYNNKDAIRNVLAGSEAVLLGIKSQKATAIGKHATFIGMASQLAAMWQIPGTDQWGQMSTTLRQQESEILSESDELVTKIQDATSKLPSDISSDFLTETDVAVIRQKINAQLKAQQNAEIASQNEQKEALN